MKAPEWQPIETAPVCGEVILLCMPKIGAMRDSSVRRVYEGLWNESQCTFTSVNGFILLTGATHWMPLPAAPEKEGSDGEVQTQVDNPKD